MRFLSFRLTYHEYKNGQPGSFAFASHESNNGLLGYSAPDSHESKRSFRAIPSRLAAIQGDSKSRKKVVDFGQWAGVLSPSAMDL